MQRAPEETFYSAQPTQIFQEALNQELGKVFEPGMRYSIIEQSLSRQPIQKRDAIVELGCGNGTRLLYLKEKFGFANALGIDLCFADRGIQMADYRFFSANLNYPWPLEDQSADVLVAMMLLEHLFDPFASFREIQRVLQSEGRAFVNLPLITSVKNRFRLLAGKIPITSVPYTRWQEEGHWDGFHLHYFTIASIYDLARSANLRICKMKAVGRLAALKDLWPSFLCDEISFELRHQRPVS